MITREYYEQAKAVVAQYEQQQMEFKNNPYYTLPIQEIVLKYYYDTETDPKIALCTRIRNCLASKGVNNVKELIEFIEGSKKCLPVKKRIQYGFRNIGDVTLELLVRSIRNIGFDLETEIS